MGAWYSFSRKPMTRKRLRMNTSPSPGEEGTRSERHCKDFFRHNLIASRVLSPKLQLVSDSIESGGDSGTYV